MKKISAIVVDDEKGVRELLTLLIAKYCPEIELTGEASDADMAFELITEKKPELVFLDIQMPKGDGFSLLKRFENPSFDVIFTTSYGEYAVWAFKVDAVDYLLKPYEINELKKAVDKVIRKRNMLRQPENEKNALTVHKNDKVEKVLIRSIVALEAQNNYTLIITNDQQKYLISKVLSDLEDELNGSGSFLRIHRSVIVNTDFIKSYSKNPPYSIVMTNNASYEISRRRRSEILDFLKGN